MCVSCDVMLAAKPYTDRDLPTAPPLSPAAQRRQQQLQHARQQRQQQQLDREDRCLSPAKLLKGSSSGSNRGRSQGKQTAAQKHNAGVKADSKVSMRRVLGLGLGSGVQLRFIGAANGELACRCSSWHSGQVCNSSSSNLVCACASQQVVSLLVAAVLGAMG